jgi:hypothetical protein
MVVDRSDKVTLRIGRLEFTRLGWALVLSLVAHLVFWGGYEVTKHFDLTARFRLPKWAQRLLAPPPVAVKPKPQAEPYMFVDVSEAQSVAEAPKDALNYSDRNAVAANPDANKNLNEPKVEGEKNEYAKLEDAGRKNKFDQLMPDPPKPEAEPKPEEKQAPGTMTVAKADLRPPQERQRPRTIAEAMRQRNQTPAPRSQQDAGVSRRGELSRNVKVTGFGAYDRAFIDAVSSRWYGLLDNLSYDNWRTGKVVVRFDLNYKGEIAELVVVENTVSDMLALMCEKAIRDPAPYGEWTTEMRQKAGDSRRITFTFFYH